MKQINLTVRGGTRLSPTILIDGKAIKTKKSGIGAKTGVFKTEKDKVEISIFRYLEINGRLWFLMNIIYFLIGVFGIFDFLYDKNCAVLDCKFVVDTTEQTNLEIAFNSLIDKGRAVEIESDTNVTEIKNMYYVDQKAKKRRKIAIITRIVLLIAIVVTCVFVFIK